MQLRTGEIIILWLGGLLSALVLVIYGGRVENVAGGPLGLEQPSVGTVVGGIFAALAFIGAIWITCALVWVTMYKREKH
jgi:hypothetical protein